MPHQGSAPRKASGPSESEADSKKQHAWCLKKHTLSTRTKGRPLGRRSLLQLARNEFGDACVVTDGSLRSGLERLRDGDNIKGAAAAVERSAAKKCLTEEERKTLVDNLARWSR